MAATTERITALHARGWSKRDIAYALDLDISDVRAVFAWTEAESKLRSTGKRLLERAKGERERQCVRANFGDVL